MRFHIAAVACLALGLVGAVQAQAPTVPVAKPDLTLLNEALLGLETDRTLDTVSQLTMTVTYRGGSSVTRERIHFAWQKPNKYHADITLFEPHGTPDTKYTLICDGRRVWFYTRSGGEYDVMPSAAYNDTGSVGLSCLGLFGSLMVGTIAGNTDGQLDSNGLAQSGFKVAGDTMTLADGAVCPVFVLMVAGRGQTMRLALDPQTATIRRMSLNEQPGVMVAVTETLARQSIPTQLSPSLFCFAPPPGAKRIKTLSYGLF